MLTLDDKGGGGVGKPTKLAYVIHGCSLANSKNQFRCVRLGWPGVLLDKKSDFHNRY